ncbi:FadR/GntR family transcriptional regulator [Mesorhizobium sp. BAC0120]|uniref:FadR/GntR family transcriptional regulator n=1 Tax=Mesorhizobium sp. BAC0120 TaxID=3090670 RepID=UPI00298BFCE7|nr:FadR/GntR family transcriptional regulator [Mesorhizobium sp. BAC0120]MDW6024358.1 FadR/GntR family transcriptional regulator [Mesorhizobium sp. BAC0120]
MPFQAVATQRLYEQVAEQVSRLIAAGEFSAGDRLPPERDLARQLAVSRPVLREAMVALELAGWVEVRSGAGTYVRAIGRTPLNFVNAGPGAFELLAARRTIEGEVAALAAATAREADVAELSALNEEIRRETAAGRTGVDVDGAFHRRLAEVTGNAVLVDIVSYLWAGMNGPILARFHDLTNRPGKHRTNIADHEAIIAALGRHDAEGARQAMAIHIGHVEAVFAEDLAETVLTKAG